MYTLLDVEFVDHVCLIAVSVKLFHIKIGEYKQRHRPLSFSPVEFSSTSGSNKYTYSHAGRNGTHCGNYLVLKFKGMGFWSVLTALYISNLGLKNLILEMVSLWRLPRSVCGYLESSWNVMAHGDAREGKWMRNWRMQWVARTLHTTSEHGLSNISTADAHTSAASSRLNWRHPADLNGLVRFAERRNLVSVRLPSRFNWPLPRFHSDTV